MITVPLRADTLAMRAVFDALFPSTPFKKMIVSCIQLQGAMAKLSTCEDVHCYQAMILGHLDCLERAVLALAGEKLKCRTTDLDYVLTILENVGMNAQKVADVEQDSQSLLARVIEIRNNMERLL